ncbi:hypothetical protein V8F20_010103 [Naviculisporaceae sp. PSN 640]
MWLLSAIIDKMTSSDSNKKNNPQQSENKPLRQIAAEKLHGPDANPSQLGDPISLKAETTNSEFPASGQENNQPGPADVSLPQKTPAPHDTQGKVGKPSTTLEGDATSLKAETTKRDPVDHDNGVPAVGRGSPKSKL